MKKKIEGAHSSCKFGLTLILVIIILPILITNVLAVEYNCGLSEGHYIKYGNYDVTPATDIEVDWTKEEVISVSGNEVTIRFSGQFDNGTVLPNSGGIRTYNIQAGTVNGTDITYGSLIAANLNEGDLIPPLSYGYIVNKTETRTYLGVSRTVNILETIYSGEIYSNHWFIVYDKASGIMLEQEFERTDKTPNSELPYLKQSMSVSETNIFDDTAPNGSSPLPFDIIIVLAVAIVGVIVLITFLFFRKRSE